MMNRPPSNAPRYIIDKSCAGSGKTHRLIGRALAILLGAQPCPLHRILILTYTRAGVSEIRHRLAEEALQLRAPDAIADILAKYDIEPTDAKIANAHSLAHRLLLSEPNININTFHGWFYELLLVTGYPNKNVIEDITPYRRQAQIELFHSISDDARLRNAIDGILHLASASGHSLHHALTRICDLYYDNYTLWKMQGDDAPAISELPMLTDLRRACHGWSRPIKAARALIDAFDGEDDLDICIAIVNLHREHHAGGAKTAIRHIEQYMSIELFDEIADAAAATLQHSFDRHARIIGEAYLAQLDRLYHQHHAIDFKQMESLAWQMITQKNGVPQLFENDVFYRHILIDEFQDTNVPQWAIVREWLNHFHSSDAAPNVYIVGDIKQSIFGFQGGTPQLLDIAQGFLAQYYRGSLNHLSASRRCHRRIITFVNQLFRESGGDIPAEFYNHDEINDAGDSLIRLYPLIPRPTTAEDVAFRNPFRTARQVRYNSHDILAENIASLINDELVGRTLIGQHGATRPCCYSDIMVILRQFTHYDCFARQFDAAGIPFSTNHRGHAFTAQEERDLINLLTVLAQPNDILALAGVLKSPLFGVDDSELTALSPHFSWQSLRDYTGGSERLQRARRLLNSWQSRTLLPVGDLLEIIFHEGDLPARYRQAAPQKWYRTRERLLGFIDYALSVDGGRSCLVTQFLTHIREQEGARTKADSAAGEERINLTTIHSAKGKEAAVVILAEANIAPEDSAGHDDILCAHEWDFTTLRPTNIALTRRAWLSSHQRQLKQEKDFQEDLCLLYVALTRAKQHLFIFGTAGGREKSNSWYAKIKQSLDALGARDVNAGMYWELGESTAVEYHADEQPGAPVEAADSPAIEHGEPQSRSERRGVMIHEQLAQLLLGQLLLKKQSGSDADAAAEKMFRCQWLHERLAQAQDYWVEREVISDGELLRPDCVIFDERAIWIVDFKTGAHAAANPKNQQQLSRYRAAMKTLYPAYDVHTAIIDNEAAVHHID